MPIAPDAGTFDFRGILCRLQIVRNRNRGEQDQREHRKRSQLS